MKKKPLYKTHIVNMKCNYCGKTIGVMEFDDAVNIYDNQKDGEPTVKTVSVSGDIDVNYFVL